MAENERFAEYYFDYKIERVYGDKNIMAPKIYFEKDYTKQNLPYCIFAVPQEWLGKHGVFGKTCVDITKSPEAEEFEYDTVKVVYDKKGADFDVFNGDKAGAVSVERKFSVPVDEFYITNGARIEITSGGGEHSGVGYMEMLKKHNVVARFFFAVNFAIRKKISYSLKKSGKSLELEFKCKERPKGISVRVVYNGNHRLPCLKADMCDNIALVDGDIELVFSKGAVFKDSYKLTDDAREANAPVFSVAFSNPETERFYILDRMENNTVPYAEAHTPKYIQRAYTCPYCHEPIDVGVASSSEYKRGGALCQLDPLSTKKSDFPVIYANAKRTKHKKCMYCKDDIDSSNNFQRPRLLPDKYMEHDTFKIAFMGAARSGKTTFISRMFELAKEKPLLNMMKNCVKEYDGESSVDDVKILKVKQNEASEYQLDEIDTRYEVGQSEYTSRIIGFAEEMKPTDSEVDFSFFPFITEINKNAYICFYDIAGEDSKKNASLRLQMMARQDCIGIYLIIDGDAGIDTDTQNVINELKSANLDPNCPIAIIVNKMDKYEDEFDPNCYCLRTDYYDGKGYDGAIRHYIDRSSEEIRSFLQTKSFAVDLDDKYRNIKYFGVSLFNVTESIAHKISSDRTSASKLQFMSSPKRMDLPFFWLMKQFDI